jgi:hypothetical protein
MFKDIYKRANNKISIKPQLMQNTSNKVNKQFKGISEKHKIFNRYRMSTIPVCLAIVLCLVMGIPRILGNPSIIPTPHSSSGPAPKGPIPKPFEYPIEIKSDSYPLHLNQEFIIKTKERNWEGSNVRIYYLDNNEQNTNELMFNHVLPKDSKLIGSEGISQGQWRYKWQVPKYINEKGYGSFYIIAKSDKDIISGVIVYTLPYNNFDISPKDVSVGQEVKYNISGFPKGCSIEIHLNIPGKRIATLGIFKNTNGSLTSSFRLPEVIEGNKITPGQYEIQATMIPKDEKKEIRQAIFADFNVK